MSGNNFTKYLFENFSFLICTPLCSYLYNFIIDIWSDKDFKFMDYFSFEQKKLMMHIIYEKNYTKYLNNMILDDEKDEYITKFIDNIRSDFNYPKELPNNINKFNDKIFKLIYNNVICNNVKDELDTLENNIQLFEKKLNLSCFSNELKKVFNIYYDIILNKMVHLEKYIDSQKVIFIKNYLDLIYDLQDDKLSNEEIYYVVNKKVNEYNKYVQDNKKNIKNKCTIFSSFLEKWINIYEDGENVFKINLYPNKYSFEEVNIYQDICNIGEVDLIQLISPLINKMCIDDKKNILNKMSSGTKKKCEQYFISEYEISKKMFELSKDDKFIKKIKFKATNQKEFNNQIKTVVDKIHSIITNEGI